MLRHNSDASCSSSSVNVVSNIKNQVEINMLKSNNYHNHIRPPYEGPGSLEKQGWEQQQSETKYNYLESAHRHYNCYDLEYKYESLSGNVVNK